MLHQLQKAIVQEYLQSLDALELRTVCESIYAGTAPQGKSYPFIVFDALEGAVIRTICPKDADVSPIEFKVYARESQRALNIAGRVREFFENREVTMDDFRVIRARSTSVGKRYDEIERIYIATVTIEYTTIEQ